MVIRYVLLPPCDFFKIQPRHWLWSWLPHLRVPLPMAKINELHLQNNCRRSECSSWLDLMLSCQHCSGAEDAYRAMEVASSYVHFNPGGIMNPTGRRKPLFPIKSCCSSQSPPYSFVLQTTMSPFHLLLTLLFACLTLSTPIVSNYNDDSSFPVEAPAENQDYIITTSTVELQKRRPPVVLRYCLMNKKGCGQMAEDAFPTGGDEWSMQGSQLVRKLRLGLCYNFYWVYLPCPSSIPRPPT
jgi:hypothetical protein